MTGPREPDAPITDAERRELRSILGLAAVRPTVIDNVLLAREWCERNGAAITFDKGTGRYSCNRGAEVLATAMDLGILVGKLERLGDDA